MNPFRLLVCLSLLCLPAFADAQEVGDSSFSRLNTFSIVGEYSNDSSHIFLGRAENRKIGDIGVQYQRRLAHRRAFDFSYMAELRPAVVESDPTSDGILVVTLPKPYTINYGRVPVRKCVQNSFAAKGFLPDGQPYSQTINLTCGRRMVVGQAFSPIGFRLNLKPRHRIQPTFSILGGYMFSTEKIPTIADGSYNFTFEVGAGFDFFRSHRRSMRLEYAVQHYSNAGSGVTNTGVDSGLIKLSYAFGR